MINRTRVGRSNFFVGETADRGGGKKAVNRYSAFAISLVLSALITSCGTDAFVLDDSQFFLEQSGDFAQTSFDGCWDWYEQDEQTLRIIIANGAIASLTPAGRTAMSLNAAEGNCLISSHEGLVALTYAMPTQPGETQRITTFRFDLRDTRAASMSDSLARGVIRGHKSVEDNDPDDILPLPPVEEQDGYLVLCDSND